MNRKRTLFGFVLAWFVLTAFLDIRADDKPVAMKTAFIRTIAGQFLVLDEGETKFRDAKPRERTAWNIGFRKEGVWIIHAKSGKVLGIDPKKRLLALFDDPGPTTIWQLKPAGANAIAPPREFEALLFMKLEDEELRVSTDEMGKPILGGKATILLFYRDGL